MRASRKLAEHKFKFGVQRGDKGGATVIISEGILTSPSRAHVQNDKAYELASTFGNVLAVTPAGMRKHRGQ